MDRHIESFYIKLVTALAIILVAINMIWFYNLFFNHGNNKISLFDTNNLFLQQNKKEGTSSSTEEYKDFHTNIEDKQYIAKITMDCSLANKCCDVKLDYTKTKIYKLQFLLNDSVKHIEVSRLAGSSEYKNMKLDFIFYGPVTKPGLVARVCFNSDALIAGFGAKAFVNKDTKQVWDKIELNIITK